MAEATASMWCRGSYPLASFVNTRPPVNSDPYKVENSNNHVNKVCYKNINPEDRKLILRNIQKSSFQNTDRNNLYLLVESKNT
jgi:hypothetical protein